MSKLEHVETMNSGSSLVCLDSETLEGTKNSFTGREAYWASPLLEGLLFTVSPDSWETVSLVPVPGEPQCNQTVEASVLCPPRILSCLCASPALRKKGSAPKRGVGTEPQGIVRALEGQPRSRLREQEVGL